ncbi:MAG: rhamnogalacturonan acetylesterase [Terracidiphilus sp.]|nr:rhamnogalacturonan acetylesterase [Terracidiphilus sp.]
MNCFRLVALAAFAVATAPFALAQSAAPSAPVPKIMLVGDSTQTPSAGYGLGFCANLSGVECLNNSKGGASTKTYRADGLWDRALAAHPNYMLIQFGHNDEQSAQHLPRETDLATEYPANLRRYVAEARAAGIVPILVTPLTRRYYQADGKIHSDLTAHSQAMKKVAAELHTPLIDLQSLSIAYLDTTSEANAGRLGLTKKDADGRNIPDKTHLNPLGAYVFGRIVVVELGKAVPALAAHVRPYAAVLPPDAIRTVDIFNNARFRVVLVGDSTVNPGGGWGAGFCPLLTPNVECINLALNGRSSKSFYDEGAWKKALDQRPDYILIQFGHNDQPGKGPERETDPNTTYSANLRRYIAEARAIGARPILVTSLSRRNYKDGQLSDTLAPYAEATRRVAAEQGVPLVDLYAASAKLLRTLTQEQADKYDAETHPDAKQENQQSKGPDRTHLNPEGQKLFGSMVADSLARICPEFGPNLLSQSN